jgi:hypothetical protein
MYDIRQTIRLVSSLVIEAEKWVPLAALAAVNAPEATDDELDAFRADLPIAYIPRGIGVPEATSFREVLERSVNWGRR